MSDPRFFVPEALSGPGERELPPAVAHHALRVLRLRAGDPLVLFDGQGGEWRARLLAAPARGDAARAELLAFDPVGREASVPLVLVQSLVAQEKLDWVIPKAVEAGAARVLVCPAARSGVRLEADRAGRRAARWAALAAAAAEQCGRTRVPPVELVDSPAAALAALPAGCERFALDPGATAGLGGLCPPAAGAAVFIGPEGGFVEGELAALAAGGCRRVRLGPRVLRTETAGLVAIATLLAAAGEYS